MAFSASTETVDVVNAKSLLCCIVCTECMHDGDYTRCIICLGGICASCYPIDSGGNIVCRGCKLIRINYNGPLLNTNDLGAALYSKELDKIEELNETIANQQRYIEELEERKRNTVTANVDELMEKKHFYQGTIANGNPTNNLYKAMQNLKKTTNKSPFQMEWKGQSISDTGSDTGCISGKSCIEF